MSRSVVNRRVFAKQLAAGSLAAAPLAIAVSETIANEPRPADKAVALQLIQELYPHALDDAQRAEIQKQIAYDQRRSKILSGFPLTNADEPAPTFAAWRGEG